MPKTKRFKFSDQRIDKIKPPTVGSRESYYDSRMPELELRVGSGGRKTFNVYSWCPKRKQAVRVKLGVFPNLSSSQARIVALEVAARLKQGQDPRAVSSPITQKSLTFGARI